MTINRHDYAFPFSIDPVSRQGARASYPAHVDQMIRQVLLTSPGERTNLPDFGLWAASGALRALFGCTDGNGQNTGAKRARYVVVRADSGAECRSIDPG